ncbi:MAG TPA: cyclic nucleotide-binding domain-containing protein [Rectinemataceae bacterium]|nr:cyclic nucleotide-binding domain-containing protein [Rectinemataceae bacterium]
MPPLDKPDAAGPEDGIPSALAALGFRRSVAAGILVFRQDERAESCFFLERGEIALRRRSRSGDEVEIARIGEGEWFGEIILFASSSFPAQAVAVRDCELVEFRRSAILGSPDPEVAIELGMAPETLSRALRQMEEEGYIKVQGSRLEIPSCDILRSLIEGD